MKQTAVDWFFDKLKNHEIQAEHYNLYKEAKEMEKEQILESFTEGCFTESWVLKSAEQYYNETYK
jgi:hypothetical protein